MTYSRKDQHMGNQLTADRVAATLSNSLFTDEEAEGLSREEIQAKAVVVEGIGRSYGFHPQRLASHRDEVYELLNELPDAFRASGGGGASVLNAHVDRHGNTWTGFHQIVDELFVLGIALDLAAWLLPREMWNALPGGMPYVAFLDTENSRNSNRRSSQSW